MVKSPIFFSRSLSRRNSNHVCHKKENEIKIRVITVKDIMQWQLFCEFGDEKSPPLHFAPSPQHCTTTTASSSNRSSWCESDCTSEYSPEECGENNLPCVGESSVQTTTAVASESEVGPKVSNYFVHLHPRRHLMCLPLRVLDDFSLNSRQ
ncbi:hypothetical protein SLE2022_179430 [Rubroshorea leprosula]